jgi:trk system potassium uptake protein
MNLLIVSYLLGKLSLACAGALLVPLIMALCLGDACLKALLISVLLATVIGYAFLCYGSFDDGHITFREGVAVVSGAWLVISFLGAMPYYFAGTLDFISAIFESISGFTTTGATTITAIEAVPKSMLFWRSMTHWMGGIGIVVLFIAFLPNIGSGAVHMFNAEVTGPTDDRVVPRIRETSVALCKIYILFTAIEAILLFLAGMSFYDCINHAFSTIATGGFSTYDNGVMHYNSPLIEGIIGLFMILAGGNFALYFSVGKKGIKELWYDTEFKVYIFLVIITTILIAVNIFYKMDFTGTEALRHSFFQVASIISTTGFVSNDFDIWPAFSKYILILLMFIGACAGSTAGGIKVSRIVILCKLTLAEIRHTVHPSMVTNVSMNGKHVPDTVIAGIGRFFFLYMMLFAGLTLALVSTGLSVTDSIGAIAATISSVGPALGVAGATSTYASITPFGKTVICVAMLLGRLELFTLLVLIRPEFWRSTRNW